MCVLLWVGESECVGKSARVWVRVHVCAGVGDVNLMVCVRR